MRLAWGRRLLQEPLVHFFLLGGGLLVLYSLVAPPAEPARQSIHVTPERLEALSANFEVVWKRPPTTNELRGLVGDFVREEVFYREALALGLDKDDTVVRRRMRQKFEFLAEESVGNLEPSEAELDAFYRENGERFRRQPRLTFAQIYLGPAAEAPDEEKVVGALARLNAGAAADELDGLAKPSLLPERLNDAGAGQVARLFGEAFAEALIAADPGAWRGPVESAYGAHLVRIEQREPGGVPPLDAVRQAVVTEWRYDAQRKMKEALFERLRDNYEIVIDWPAEEAAQ